MPPTSSKAKDLYAILGVKDTASADEIKRAYRDLAKKNHPDRTGGDKAKEAKFKEMSAAYEILSDPKKRAQYDAMRHGNPFAGQGGPGAGTHFDPSVFSDVPGFEDLFGQMFSGMGGGGAKRGRRVVYESGSGFPFEAWVDDGPAPRTRRGERAARAKEEREQVVRTADGHTFLRKGNDLHSEVRIAVDEAVLGARVTVPTFDGQVAVTVPAGTSSGLKLRLRGKGMHAPDGTRGDHYVTVQIVVPKETDERARELISEFARRAPVRPR